MTENHVRILFVVFSDNGHLNPMLALGQHLEADGHDVAFFSLGHDITAQCASAGLRATCGGIARQGGLTQEASQRSVKLGQQIGNPRWLQRWLSVTLIDSVPHAIAPLESMARTFAPDLIATDAMAYAGAIVAMRLGIRWASLATGVQSLLPPDEATSLVFQQLAPQRDTMVTSLGSSLTFRGSDVRSHDLNVAFVASELFDGDGDLQLVGPVLPLRPRALDVPFPWDRVPTDRPIVLVCFGSHLSPRPEIYPAICNALTADEAFFVCVLKDLVDAPFVADLPAYVLPVAFAPQLELLGRTAIMIHHGGANSVMECISGGVPMVISPLGYDQHLLGAAVERTGLGVVIDQAEIAVSTMRPLLLRLLEPTGPRQRARELAVSRVNGAARTIELLLATR
ncbi:glycosyltransferase [soil metagenome]